MKRMPTLFVGHGSPMMALEHTETTTTFTSIGQNIINNYGKPKAILAISAHWYADGTYIQSAENPKQITICMDSLKSSTKLCILQRVTAI